MRRIDWIDSCRFLAMFWILIGHFLSIFYPSALSLWEPGPTWWLFGGFPGKLAFTLYFVLLGFFACSPKPFDLSRFALYTLRRYLLFVFFGFFATLVFILGGYAVTWIFHTPDPDVFRILSDGPQYNLIYLLRDGFFLEDHYIDSFWCMPHLLAASVVCRLYGYLPERVRPGLRALIACAPEEAETVLERLRAHPNGRGAALIGRVTADHGGLVGMKTTLGGTRIVDMPIGEILPRIC